MEGGGGTVQYRTATLLFLSKFRIWPEDRAARVAAAAAVVMFALAFGAVPGFMTRIEGEIPLNEENVNRRSCNREKKLQNVSHGCVAVERE